MKFDYISIIKMNTLVSLKEIQLLFFDCINDFKCFT